MSSLTTPGWTDQARAQLSALIREGAGRRLPVVFDFDNTLVWGDIGEATLAMLVRERVLTAESLPGALFAPFALPDGTIMGPAVHSDLLDYYEALLAPTVHGPNDPTPLASGYVWAVEIMQSLDLTAVTQATRRVWELSSPQNVAMLEVAPGKAAYPIPFFYPEMVELIATLLRHEFDVWIVSASNVWSVRWSVARVLNPQLRALGAQSGIYADHIVGVSTLLSDARGQLYKDAVLVRENQAYAGLQEAALEGFRLTRWLQFPVPTYAGKIGVIWDTLGQRPYLSVGDSPGDLPMLSFSQHRLWIARVEKAAYQQAMERERDRTGDSHWIVQPVRTRTNPGFMA